MMKDFIFCSKSVKFLQPKDFSPPLDWFYSRARELFDHNKRCPTKDDIVHEISRQGDEESLEYLKEMEEIEKSDVDEKTIISEMTGFIRLNHFVDTAFETTEKVKREQYDEAYDLLADRALMIQQLSFSKDKHVGFGDGLALIEKMAAQKDNSIPTGIRAIDEAMGGGMFPGTWTTFLGATNAGKSMINCSLAYFAAKAGKKTFITVHEDELGPTKLRYLARFSKIPYNKLLFSFNTLTPAERARFDNADVMLEHYVKMQFMYSTESTVEAVCDTVRSVMKEWKFDFYICDYGGCLSSKKFKSMDNTRILQEHVHHELKQLCLELDIPGAGGAQVNREAVKKNSSGIDLLRMTDVAEALGIVKKASTVITMNRSDSDMQKNLIIFLLDKSRSGKTNVAVECITDYSMACTHMEEELTRNNQRTLDLKAGLAGREEKAPEAATVVEKESHG